MQVLTRASRKKTWQTGRERVSVDAVLAIQKENVVQRLVRLRAEIGHPEKEGEPLPQDQAAARAGVTARQWQRWESGASVPYARNLSAVADAFGFDVAEFYDGPAGQQPASTPSPFAGQDGLADLADLIRQDMAQRQQQRDEIIARLDRLEETLQAAITETAAEETDNLRRLAREIVEGRPTAPRDSRLAPERPGAARKKRAAAPRTPSRP